MEKRLRAIFDYQRFDPSPRLAKLIQETESRSARELTDDEAFLVTAAGLPIKKEEKKKGFPNQWQKAPEDWK